MPQKLESEIDRLYQLPLEEFTSSRNALAKQAGPDAATIRALGKPSIAAWAVNQLYWHDRKTWDELIAAADEARRAHKAVLSGKSGDVRSAAKVHEDAVETALKRTLGLLTKAGHPATDATRQAIATTLRALPAEAPPGRLTEPLQPGGFEMLSGLSIARGQIAHLPKPAAAAVHAKPHQRGTKHEPAKPKVDPKVITRARHAIAAAEREVRSAEAAAKRAEFEKAKAERELKLAEKALQETRQALDSAAARVETTAGELDEARTSLDRSRAELERLEHQD